MKKKSDPPKKTRRVVIVADETPYKRLREKLFSQGVTVRKWFHQNMNRELDEK